jgi:uncharacterized membrane protein YfcA
MEPVEKIGSFVVFLLAGLFMSGGLGGGAMMVPILIVFFRFDSKEAIYNAYGIIFGGSIGNFLYSVREVDYDTHKPQINYDVAALAIPSLLTGTIIGVSLNRFFPGVFLLLCLTGLVVFTFTKIFTRA